MVNCHELKSLGMVVTDVFIEGSDVVLINVFDQEFLHPLVIVVDKKIPIQEFDTTAKRNYQIHSVSLKKIWENKTVHTVSLPNCFVFEKSLDTSNSPILFQSNFITPIASESDQNVNWLYLLFLINRYKKWFENMEIKPFIETNEHCVFQSSNGDIHLYEFIIKKKLMYDFKCNLAINESLLMRVIGNVEHYFSIFFDKMIDEIKRKRKSFENTKCDNHIDNLIVHTSKIREQIPKLKNLINDISNHKTSGSMGLTNSKARIETNIKEIYSRLLCTLLSLEAKMYTCFVTNVQYQNTLDFVSGISYINDS
tara:strand:+ start:375 stop:1304 length:930 start_codon:yes stop_codon:yes gene_type:complete